MSIAVLAAVAVAGFALSRRSVRTSQAWRATVTPLASIIGSGFLVIAPLLVGTVGAWAPAAMLGIALMAFAIGSVVRFNIEFTEDQLKIRESRLHDIDSLSEVALGFAYVVSVAFYLQLLASFLLQPLGIESQASGKAVAASLVVLIGVVGWVRSLDGLELLEEVAVTAKLAIIAGLVLGAALFVVGDPAGNMERVQSLTGRRNAWDVVRTLAGMLLVVQGFETSRYLGAKYSGTLRIATMRRAQIVSSVIYVAFVTLILPLADRFPTEVNETAILDAASAITPLLVPLLIVAAVASQFSAAVADTAGGGGLVAAARNGATASYGYGAIAAGAFVVILATDVFGVIALASRAFAFYYLLQTVAAIRCSQLVEGSSGVRRRMYFALVALLLVFVVVAGAPVG